MYLLSIAIETDDPEIAAKALEEASALLEAEGVPVYRAWVTKNAREPPIRPRLP